jgi:hypothetical protein
MRSRSDKVRTIGCLLLVIAIFQQALARECIVHFSSRDRPRDPHRMQNLLTAMRKFWGRKAPPAHIGEELTVGAGEIGLPFERDPNEWAALLDWLGKAECERNGQVRRVLYPDPYVLDVGTRLYRARKHQSEQALREELKQQPNYFATSRPRLGNPCILQTRWPSRS